MDYKKPITVSPDSLSNTLAIAKAAGYYPFRMTVNRNPLSYTLLFLLDPDQLHRHENPHHEPDDHSHHGYGRG